MSSVHTHMHNLLTALWILSWTEPVSEETFTNTYLSWSSIIPYLLPSSITIHGIISVFSLDLKTVTESSLPFSALTLLVGWQEGHLACKNWVMRYWHGYLSGERCKWYANGPADATATPSSLASLKSRMAYLSGIGLPRLSCKKGR